MKYYVWFRKKGETLKGEKMTYSYTGLFDSYLGGVLYYTWKYILSLFSGVPSPYFGKRPKYTVEMVLSEEFADEGPWRSYNLESYGDSLKELWDNATVSEVDQDGGELVTYDVLEYGNYSEIEAILMDTLNVPNWD